MIGRHIRHAREQAGLTQEQLAVRASVSREYVSMLENDRKSPTFDLLVRVCWAMKASVTALVADAEKDMLKQGRKA